MVKAASERASTSLSPGKLWIEKALQDIGEELGLLLETWFWETEAVGGAETMWSLIVVGSRGKKAGKLFTKDEIDRCLWDQAVQREIQVHLTKILGFLGPNH